MGPPPLNGHGGGWRWPHTSTDHKSLKYVGIMASLSLTMNYRRITFAVLMSGLEGCLGGLGWVFPVGLGGLGGSGWSGGVGPRLFAIGSDMSFFK